MGIAQYQINLEIDAIKDDTGEYVVYLGQFWIEIISILGRTELLNNLRLQLQKKSRNYLQRTLKTISRSTFSNYKLNSMALRPLKLPVWYCAMKLQWKYVQRELQKYYENYLTFLIRWKSGKGRERKLQLIPKNQQIEDRNSIFGAHSITFLHLQKCISSQTNNN